MISVIIPTLNEAEHIRDLLGDLAPMREHGHEIILVDGGSSDATRELAANSVDLILQVAPGRARQMNAGAEQAVGDFLWFLHADCRVPHLAWEAVLASRRHWGRFDVQLSGQDIRLRLVERMMNLRSRVSGIATGDQGIFVRPTTFNSVGGFPDIPLMEDIALSKRLRKRAVPDCLKTGLITSSRRWENKGVLRTILLMWFLRFAYFIGVSPKRLAGIYYSKRRDNSTDGVEKQC